MGGSHSFRTTRRLGALAGLSVAVGVLATGCSSSPTAAKSTTTTSTVPPPATTAPPVQSSTAQVVIQGSGATISFTSSDISGSLAPQPGTFSQGGTLYTFTVTGVQYSGSPATSTATGGLIQSVTVAHGSGGAVVIAKLASSAAHASYGLGHNEVGVTFS